MLQFSQHPLAGCTTKDSRQPSAAGEVPDLQAAIGSYGARSLGLAFPKARAHEQAWALTSFGE